MSKEPKIVCLCGSVRFKEDFELLACECASNECHVEEGIGWQNENWED